MFERFTERARQVVVLAQQEARSLNSDQIDTPHLLLGLIAEEEGVGARALGLVGIDLAKALGAVETLSPRGSRKTRDQIPFSPIARQAIEKALSEAIALGNNYIGTEHLLLGLLVADGNSTARILIELGTSPELVAQVVYDVLGISTDQLRSLLSRIPAPAVPASPEPEPEPSSQIKDETEAIEAIPTHSDRPASRDELGRMRIAEVLGERIRRVRGEDTEAPARTRREREEKRRRDASASRQTGQFLVHVHAPWGAGKSSLLNFLAGDLRNRQDRAHTGLISRVQRFLSFRKSANPRLSQWVVVEFSAWEHQRLAPPWWWLLAEVQRSCARELWWIDRGRWALFWIRDLAWRIWNARAAVLTASLIVVALLVGWISDWFGVKVSSLTALQAVLLTVGSVITIATTLLGLAAGTGRWLAIGSAAGADRFLRRAQDPLGIYRQRFRWLVRSCNQPIAVFIDDLDRCRPEYVVELLEGIQTLFSEEPVAYVVAADRTWLCQSFAKAYEDFEEVVGEPGRPLGFLFLEKTFQISLEIPPMSKQDQERYWAELLRGQEPKARHAAQAPETATRPETFIDAATPADVEGKISGLLDSEGLDDDALVAAVRRLNAPDMQLQLEKLLLEFAPLLENNPRSMKRLMNAYGIERDRLLREGRLLKKRERRQLALLTILRMRWPLLAEHLRRHPEDAALFTARKKAPDGHPFQDLLENQELRSLFDGLVVDEKLEADLLREFPSVS